MNAVSDAPATATMSTGDVTTDLRIRPRTLWRWISEGRFPAPDIRIGAKVVRWRRATFQQWLDAQCEGGAR